MPTAVAPTMSVAIAKNIIDNAFTKGSSYMNGPVRRTGDVICISFTCIPCISWSVLARLICCPYQCVANKTTCCNPLASLMTDNALTMNSSDKCLIATCEAAFKKGRIVSMPSEEDNNAVILYAAAKVREAGSDIKAKYAIVDVVESLVFGTRFIVTLTPASLLQLADQIESTANKK
jgi:hypothetical protein